MQIFLCYDICKLIDVVAAKRRNSLAQTYRTDSGIEAVHCSRFC